VRKTEEKENFRKITPVNMTLYKLATSLLGPPLLHFCRVQAENVQAVPSSGPALLLINHVNFFDPIWVYAMVNRPIYFVTSEDIFRNRFVAPLIRWFGGFPKRKAAKDMIAVRNIIKLIRRGKIIGIFPEGVRSWDGLNLPLEPAIAGLIRKMKVPVIGCRLEGAYLALPRWANKLRKIPVRGVFKLLYDSRSIPENPEAILQHVSVFLRNRDYELDIVDAKYRTGGLAIDVTRIIYRCPSCGTFEGLKIARPLKTNRVECASCFSLWEVTPSCRMIPLDERGRPDGEEKTLAGYHLQISLLPLYPIDSRDTLELQQDEMLLLRSKPHFLKREETFPKISTLSIGRIFLTNRHLIFRNRYRLILSAPLAEVHSLSTEAGNRFNFVFRSKLYHISIRTESILKWYDTIIRLQREPVTPAQRYSPAYREPQ